jgi:hypothetical protein
MKRAPRRWKREDGREMRFYRKVEKVEKGSRKRGGDADPRLNRGSGRVAHGEED